MGDGTGISWTDASWNCFRGCSRTIAAGATQSGCGDPSGGGCYAERDGWRFAGPGLPYEGLVRMTPHGARWTGKVLLVDEHLLDPVRWTKARRIFTTSVSDPFHERFTNETIAVAFGVMVATRRHTHQLLTKRVGRAREWFAWAEREAASSNGGRGMSPAAFCFVMLQRYVADAQRFSEADRCLVRRGDVVAAAMASAWPPPNVMLGASTEHQAALDARLGDLLACPAAVHFLSVEPLLGPVWLPTVHIFGPSPTWTAPRIGWLIAGCESGPGARPCDVAWLRSLRDQCAVAGVQFFLKQAVDDGRLTMGGDGPPAIAMGFTSKRKPGGVIELPYLDGVQHAAFPTEQR